MKTYAQKELRAGLFRGVPFETLSTSLTVGRRTQVFEYPQRDTPFVEDLGRKCRTITFTAFVTGTDYIAGMNRLIAALEEPGSGELVHPWLGTMLVVPQAANRISYSQKLLTASAELEFVESGESLYPSAEKDDGYFSRSFADALSGTAVADFASKFNLDGVQDFVSAAVSGNLADLLQIEGLQTVAKMFEISDALSELVSDAVSLVSLDPKVLGQTLANSLGLGGFVTSANNWRKVARQLSRLTSGDELDGQSSMRFVSKTTTELIAENTAALEDLVRQVSVANLVGASTVVGTNLDRPDGDQSSLVMAYDELIAVRDEILQAVDEEMQRCKSDEVYRIIEQARASVWADMTKRAEGNARLIEYTPPEVMPAVVLAYNYYGDASREAEIVERNNIRHGGFVPAVPLKLLSQ